MANNNLDYIQRQIDLANAAQLKKCITLCKQFLQLARADNEFLDSEPVIAVITRLRDCAIAECLRRDINFVL